MESQNQDQHFEVARAEAPRGLAAISLAEAPALFAPRSSYWGQTADEVYGAYWSRNRTLRICYIAVILGLAVIAIAAIGYDFWPVYALCMIGMIALWIAFSIVLNKRFAELMTILNQDCNVRMLRRVLELLGSRVRKNKTRMSLEVYLALCDYLEGDPMGALTRLAGVTFKQKSSMWLMVYNVRALAANEIGDTATRDEAYTQMLQQLQAVRMPAAQKESFQRVLDGMRLRFMPHDRWTSADGELMRSMLAHEDQHRQAVGWALLLAEYEMLHGEQAIARALLAAETLQPITPSMAKTRTDLLERLDG